MIAASFTEATPSITSPSEGINRRFDHYDLSGPKFASRHGADRPASIDDELGPRLFAGLTQRCACALPRPSATASAKLANSTVNHSQMMIWNVKPSARPH